jgi:hypothetical protein
MSTNFISAVNYSPPVRLAVETAPTHYKDRLRGLGLSRRRPTLQATFGCTLPRIYSLGI